MKSQHPKGENPYDVHGNDIYYYELLKHLLISKPRHLVMAQRQLNADVRAARRQSFILSESNNSIRRSLEMKSAVVSVVMSTPWVPSGSGSSSDSSHVVASKRFRFREIRTLLNRSSSRTHQRVKNSGIDAPDRKEVEPRFSMPSEKSNTNFSETRPNSNLRTSDRISVFSDLSTKAIVGHMQSSLGGISHNTAASSKRPRMHVVLPGFAVRVSRIARSNSNREENCLNHELIGLYETLESRQPVVAVLVRGCNRDAVIASLTRQLGLAKISDLIVYRSSSSLSRVHSSYSSPSVKVVGGMRVEVEDTRVKEDYKGTERVRIKQCLSDGSLGENPFIDEDCTFEAFEYLDANVMLCSTSQAPLPKPLDIEPSPSYNNELRSCRTGPEGGNVTRARSPDEFPLPSFPPPAPMPLPISHECEAVTLNQRRGVFVAKDDSSFILAAGSDGRGLSAVDVASSDTSHYTYALNPALITTPEKDTFVNSFTDSLSPGQRKNNNDHNPVSVCFSPPPVPAPKRNILAVPAYVPATVATKHTRTPKVQQQQQQDQSIIPRKAIESGVDSSSVQLSKSTSSNLSSLVPKYEVDGPEMKSTREPARRVRRSICLQYILDSNVIEEDVAKMETSDCDDEDNNTEIKGLSYNAGDAAVTVSRSGSSNYVVEDLAEVRGDYIRGVSVLRREDTIVDASSASVSVPRAPLSLERDDPEEDEHARLYSDGCVDNLNSSWNPQSSSSGCDPIASGVAKSIIIGKDDTTGRANNESEGTDAEGDKGQTCVLVPAVVTSPVRSVQPLPPTIGSPHLAMAIQALQRRIREAGKH